MDSPPCWDSTRRSTGSWRDFLEPPAPCSPTVLSLCSAASLSRRRGRRLDDDDDHDSVLDTDHDVTEAVIEPVTVSATGTWRDHLVADVPLVSSPAPSTRRISSERGNRNSEEDEDDEDIADLELLSAGDEMVFEPFSDTCGECECDEDGGGHAADVDLDGLDLALFEPAPSEDSSSVCSACCCRCREEEDGEDEDDPGLASAVSGSLLYIFTGAGKRPWPGEDQDTIFYAFIKV
ncbi:uncharacterized protein LOC127751266 [Frankliniella occidentalis]|uniref:Uncharacterized protein LOC127751266 n=1 Tax=Frankliniella occidentalis TaxID=133901 RepID=A0A9C6XTL8_FRAOC|nr:uncharacterized protein LOC127751266 [Frankliniella occidentalis]